MSGKICVVTCAPAIKARPEVASLEGELFPQARPKLGSPLPDAWRWIPQGTSRISLDPPARTGQAI
jgi:hypothetical protein